MSGSRYRLMLVVVALLASACASSTVGVEGEPAVGDTQVVDEEPEVFDSESTVTEDEVIAAENRAARDDVAVRLVEAAPVAVGGSSVLSAEVFAVLGTYGDAFVALPSLSVTSRQSVEFTSVPDGCTVTAAGVECAVDIFTVALGNNSAVETDALLLEFEYSVANDAELPVVFELAASSLDNPVENDPDPSNNTITVEVEPATDDTPVVDEEFEVDEGESTVSEDEVISAEVRDARDDVAVRLVEATPASAGGSSSLSAEVFAVLGIHGDAFVVLPSLNVTTSQSVEFTSVPDGCMVTAMGVDCAVDTATVAEGINSTVETDALLFEFEYSVADDAEFPVVFELAASSFNNSVENDPDPSNNTITVEVEAG